MNVSTQPTPLCATRDAVGESPVWSVSEQALYWVDIEGKALRRLAWESRQQDTWYLPERVGCIALSDRGTVIAAMETGIFELERLAPPVCKLRCLARVQYPQPGMRFNDGRCDATGRFWVGSMVRDMSLASDAGGIYCLDERGLSGPLLTGYVTANGMAFSPDSQHAYLSDSHPTRQTIFKHSFDANKGTWGAGSAWVNMQALPGRPDGAAMDSEGHYWSCGNDAGLVHCFGSNGQLLRSLPVPVSKPAMCAFGGPALRHLFVTTIQPSAPAPGYDASLDGALFVLDPGVQGLPEPLFCRFPLVSSLPLF